MGCCCAGYHDADIGYWINWIEQFKDQQEGDFTGALDAYLIKFFNDAMMSVSYDADTETIILQVESEVLNNG